MGGITMAIRNIVKDGDEILTKVCCPVEKFDEKLGVLLDDMIQQALLFVGKHSYAMSKEDKINFIRYLDERGAFLISKSGPRVCKTLNISKYTLYKYLDLIRENYNLAD